MTESAKTRRRRVLQVAPRPPGRSHTACNFRFRDVSANVIVAVCSLLAASTAAAPAVANEMAECTARTASKPMEDLDALQDRLSQELVEWVRSTEGGYINDKVQLRRGNNGDGPRGLYADKTIEAGEIICTIPWSIIVKPYPEDDEEDKCSTMEWLYDDMKEARTPHGRYLESMPRNFLPPWWSDSGRELLQQLVGKRLPPQGVWHNYWSNNYAGEAGDCDGDMNDELWSHAVAMISGRADDHLLVPFYDMINHRNGHYYNTRHNISEGQFFQLVAHRRIDAGEQLHSSYNQCNVCGGRHDEYGTPEVFEQYGFVESLPQRWYVHQVRLKFDLVESDDGKGEPQVKFIVPPSIWGVKFMEEEARRLEQFSKNYRDDKSLAASIPPLELEIIWQYHDAVLTAFNAAILAAEGKIDEIVWLCDCDWYLVRDWEEEGCTFEE